jgi:ferredoxin
MAWCRSEEHDDGAEGVFAGGDMVPSERRDHCHGHGKKAARHIDAWLRGGVYTSQSLQPTVDYAALHLHYLTEAQQRRQVLLPVAQRTLDFSEVTAGLSRSEAQYEAARCYSCGNCFECDGCLGACPETAIRSRGRASPMRSTTPAAPVARPACCSALAMPWKWSAWSKRNEWPAGQQVDQCRWQ